MRLWFSLSDVDEHSSKGKREVSTEEGQKLADEWGVPFIECSAFNGVNVNEMWREAAKLALTLEFGFTGGFKLGGMALGSARNLTKKRSLSAAKKCLSRIEGCKCLMPQCLKGNEVATLKKVTDDICFFGT